MSPDDLRTNSAGARALADNLRNDGNGIRATSRAPYSQSGAGVFAYPLEIGRRYFEAARLGTEFAEALETLAEMEVASAARTQA